MTKDINNKTIACTEILNILNYVEKEYYDKVPNDLIELFKQNSIKFYQYYDENGNLRMSNLTKQILSYINLEYWCEPEEKEKLIEMYKENDKELSEKFDIQKIFDEREKRKNTIKENKEESQMAIVKEDNFIIKIIKKIKSFLTKR